MSVIYASAFQYFDNIFTLLIRWVSGFQGLRSVFNQLHLCTHWGWIFVAQIVRLVASWLEKFSIVFFWILKNDRRHVSIWQRCSTVQCCQVYKILNFFFSLFLKMIFFFKYLSRSLRWSKMRNFDRIHFLRVRRCQFYATEFFQKLFRLGMPVKWWITERREYLATSLNTVAKCTQYRNFFISKMISFQMSKVTRVI